MNHSYTVKKGGDQPVVIRWIKRSKTGSESGSTVCGHAIDRRSSGLGIKDDVCPRLSHMRESNPGITIVFRHIHIMQGPIAKLDTEIFIGFKVVRDAELAGVWMTPMDVHQIARFHRRKYRNRRTSGFVENDISHYNIGLGYFQDTRCLGKTICRSGVGVALITGDVRKIKLTADIGGGVIGGAATESYCGALDPQIQIAIANHATRDGYLSG